MTRMLVVSSPSLSPLSTAGPLPTDGPYPFTVAVWQEVEVCGACRTPLSPDWWKNAPACDLHVSGRCDPWSVEDTVGAVVATVEVLEPSHETGYQHHEHHHLFCCQVDTLGWHTPTSTVTRLDVPIPMERPMWCRYCEMTDRQASMHTLHEEMCDLPAPWWWADLDLEVPA